MPGILGGFKLNQTHELHGLFERMAGSMNDGGGHSIDKYVDENLGAFLGRVSMGTLNPLPQPVTIGEGDLHVVFHGELYGSQRCQSDPEYVLSRYRESGDGCARELNGIFHFAILDRQEKVIKLFSDKFGLQPLYYVALPKGIVFGAEVKSLLQDQGIAKEIDYRSFADFFHYGQVLGKKTLFKNIQLLAPGSVLTFDMARCSTAVKKYWHLDSLFSENGRYDLNVNQNDVVDTLVDSIRSRSENSDLIGLSLSGGLDSRGILAGLGDFARGMKTYTLGLPGCADERLANQMAAAAGTDHDFIPLNQEYIANFENMASEMIRLSDGMYHPHESTEILALEYFKKSDFKILLRGHGGEIAKAALAYPVMVNQDVHGCKNAHEALNRIFTMTNLVLRDIDAERLFLPEKYEIMNHAPMESLEASLGEVSDLLSPPDLCIYYYITEHIRRQVVSSLDIFRSRMEIRMPYVDESFIGKLLMLPVEQRNRGEIHRRLVKRCMPALTKISDSNTGAPLDAGALRLYITDKFNAVMKRMSVKGFRHYTEFEKWHRDGFHKSSREIIFSERSMSRGIYKKDYLELIFKDHILGKKNYAHLLGTIVGLELWFRNFVD
jgi:asparagine synthase (glutamine-hydrolysing)